jgi:hypothetical protein
MPKQSDLGSLGLPAQGAHKGRALLELEVIAEPFCSCPETVFRRHWGSVLLNWGFLQQARFALAKFEFFLEAGWEKISQIPNSVCLSVQILAWPPSYSLFFHISIFISSFSFSFNKKKKKKKK